jgi:hypothetical protein
MSKLYSTKMLFANKTNQPVSLYWVDFWGISHPYNTVTPGAKMTVVTHVSTPWLIQRQNGGLDVAFPTSGPTTVDITNTPLPFTSNQANGYQKPLSVGSQLPALAAFQGSNSGTATLEFVNLTSKPARVYEWISGSKATWITNLRPYDLFYLDDVDAASLWIITDAKQNVLETFDSPKHCEVALITPDVFR